ncbi:MAG TPA: hypothetical protein PL009_01950 [Flavipsychrobacter sp.]|nr:hypothetical protein [Flavipsychrobacter sp.]
MKALEKWTGIALINLAIVALLGFVMRCKMIFSIPFLDFKYTLHAHSHFAFGGWVTLALLALTAYQILPKEAAQKKIYKWLFFGIQFNAVGMLLSFPFQGYGFFSILFSTLFIFVTYGYTFVFIRDVRKAPVARSVKLLSIAAVVYMALSSVGAFTLAYLLASKSSNMYLYKDAVYTYLHLQYSGFFTLAVFALLLHYLKVENKTTWRFAQLLNASIIPSLFISYLWHYPSDIIRGIAIIGSGFIVVSTVYFFLIVGNLREAFLTLKPTAKILITISMIAFVFKMIFQALTIVPSLGTMVFANRPVIIGFLHLVLLAFITLYLIGHFVQSELMPHTGLAAFAIWLFTTGVIVTEVVLFGQGLGFMLMTSIALATWLLLAAAACLFAGAVLIAITRWRIGANLQMNYNELKTFKQFSQS